jgi:hypothetical protein
MGGLGIEGSALILGFTGGSSNALRQLGGYESHESKPDSWYCRPSGDISVVDPIHLAELEGNQNHSIARWNCSSHRSTLRITR